MKCDCEICGGEGSVRCEECDGTGVRDIPILDVDINGIRRLSDEDTERLLAIQSDALRCMSQAARLKEMNPKASASYDQQLRETLETLEKKASEIIK
jgi:DNA-binding ferritin-like protein